MPRFAKPVALAAAASLLSQPAFAHAVAGARVFVNTPASGTKPTCR